ncbi:MAG: endonuclease/exonuclease/phosphatase family protein [Rhodothermia bacterium]|nr:MAG: endonuclease/exonuclease/phosphatase family protein [Rhodothermia bacterium]
MKFIPALLLSFTLVGCAVSEPETVSGIIRIMTFNVEDIRTDDLLRADHPRLQAAARIIQQLQPDILLINEIAYDQEGVPGYVSGSVPGQNGQRLAKNFFAVSEGEGLPGIRYQAFMAPSNTGQASGYDLNHDGRAVTSYPEPDEAAEDGTPAPQTDAGRAYGNDNWGFGTFPGQYAMALLVREEHEILVDEARTFQHFLWKDLPGANRPTDPDTGEFWYDDEIWNQFPLSSKSHWDVPIRLEGGKVIHVLASHPTPPAFDGPERRNQLRNRAEIMFWNAYITNGSFIVDDAGVSGGLPEGESFVIMGDLNADPDEGGSVDNPIGSLLFSLPAVNERIIPRADSIGIAAFPDLDDDDTAEWGLRTDYVLPSVDLNIAGASMYRWPGGVRSLVSDHFPVFIDVVLDP